MTRKRSRGSGDEGRFAYDGLERIMHEKARLGILTSIAASPRGLFFNDLKRVCALTDGNLSRHLAALEEGGLVTILRGSSDKRPQTLVRLTGEGRKRFAAYVAELEQVVRDALDADDLKTKGRRPFPEGWSPA